jgi:predicted nucleic acid-binding protein
MVNKAISDSGPIIHLNEISLLNAFSVFQTTLIPGAVSDEIKKQGITDKKIQVINLGAELKEMTKIFSTKYELDLGEAEAIVLALNEKADYFLTDDLDARIIAAEHQLEVHGTIGIILRAFRDKAIKKEEAISKLILLHEKSSLFITQNLINLAINSINNYKN